MSYIITVYFACATDCEYVCVWICMCMNMYVYVVGRDFYLNTQSLPAMERRLVFFTILSVNRDVLEMLYL